MSNSKTKNTIVKDALVLFIITLIAGLALGVAYEMTRPIIDERAQTGRKEAYQVVFNDAESFADDSGLNEKVETASEDVLEPNGMDGITIDEILEAQDGSGATLGYVISVTTPEGYGGDITLSLGYSVDGVMQGLEFGVLNETVGLGQQADTEGFKGQYSGVETYEFAVITSGATADNEIDALTGATITSDAVTKAVNAGILFINESILEKN